MPGELAVEEGGSAEAAEMETVLLIH